MKNKGYRKLSDGCLECKFNEHRQIDRSNTGNFCKIDGKEVRSICVCNLFERKESAEYKR